VDYISTRKDVDMSKLALVGVSFGGQLAPRAASREHRFSALIALDGLRSMRKAIAVELPPSILQLYGSGNKT
jgi:dienelactone hydrolase